MDGENTDNIVISKKKLKTLFLLVIVLVVVFWAGNIFSLLGSPISDVGPELQLERGLTIDDKNFLVALANSQVDLTALEIANLISPRIDWCTANGGVWNETIQQGELEVTEDVASALEEQNITVTEREGRFYASVLLVNRNGCIFVSK